MASPQVKKVWIVFDTCFVIFFLMSIVWASADYNQVPLFTLVISIILGCMFIYSKILRDDSYIGKAFYWFSQNVIVPRTKYNHLVIGLFLIVIGLLSAVMRNNEMTNASDPLWAFLVRSPSFWFIFIFVCVFNGVVGVYRYRSYNRQKRGQ